MLTRLPWCQCCSTCNISTKLKFHHSELKTL